MKRPLIIIDTDPGCDDALAIMLLYLSGKCNIKACTTVAGNGSIQNITNNARFVLDLIGSSAPLYSGAMKPLKKKQIKANVHGLGGLGGLQITTRAKANGLAVEKLIEIVNANPGKITILAIGPLTNIALAIKKSRSFEKNVKEIVIMGGAIEAPGNMSRVAEFNFFVDPEAAKIVIDSDIKKIIIPLDICNQIPLYMSDFQKLRGTRYYSVVYKMMKAYINALLRVDNIKGALMYDPLAAYYLINPKAYTLQKMDMKIETKGELTAGMSVVDRRNTGKEINNVSVVVNVNRDAFVNDFLDVIGTT